MGLCRSFRDEAGRVWNQMNEARRLAISLSEETITETSLLNIARRHFADDLLVCPATKPQEAKHGADWEWWFVHRGRARGFRVQAKRLFPSRRYESLFKSTSKFDQLDKLTSKAAGDGLTPLYCFYNFGSGDHEFHGSFNTCPHDYRGPSFWGCTLAAPGNIKAIADDTLDRLRDVQFPWHRLVCTDGMGLVDSVGKNARTIYEARRPAESAGAQADLRDKADAIPDHVRRLLELARERSLTWRSESTPEQTTADRGPSYIDAEYWTPELMEKDVSGILVVEQRE